MRTLAAIGLVLALASPTFAEKRAPSTATQGSAAPRSVSADTPIHEYSLSPELRDRAERHAHVRHLQYTVELVWSLVVLLLILRLGIAARIRTLAERVARRRFWQTCIFAPLFLLTLALLELPTGIWAHATERSFGLSIQGWGGFVRDWAVSQLLVMLLGTLLVWVLTPSCARVPVAGGCGRGSRCCRSCCSWSSSSRS